MKGSIFIALSELIESEHGIEVWDAILDEVKPKCNGIYTSIEDYPDEDVVKYVLAISRRLNAEPSDITRFFGKYLFSELNAKHPIFTKLAPDLFKFIESIETVIHKEVRKLFDQPHLPTMSAKRISEHELELKYTSPRKLCYLAEGLLFGAAEYYKNEISIEHTTCMHNGSDHCVLRIVKNGDG